MRDKINITYVGVTRLVAGHDGIRFMIYAHRGTVKNERFENYRIKGHGLDLGGDNLRRLVWMAYQAVSLRE